MFSAKSQLEKLIASHLGDYVEEYDTSSLSVCVRNASIQYYPCNSSVIRLEYGKETFN
jgi:hypothetical protein